MQSKTPKSNIATMRDLKMEQLAVQRRIAQQEAELRTRFNKVPGELFYSGMDSMIPSMLSGKVSSFALNAGKGMINHFFVKKAVGAGGLKLLSLIKPSGILKKAQWAVKSLVRRRP